MKKARIAITLLSLIALLLSGCGGKINFEITASSKNAKIKINDAEEGAFAEIGTMTVNSGKKVHIESSLNSGKVKIEFCEAVKTSAAGETEEFVAGAILETAEIIPGENIELELDPDRYFVQLTTIEQSEGTVEIKIS